MATRTADHADECNHGVDDAERTRYVDLRLRDGDVVIDDRPNENAWMRSTAAVGRECVR